MATIGRPVRLVGGHAALSGAPYPVEPRFAWLIQVNRLAHFPDISRRDFAGLLQNAGFAADEWKLTRWESGDQKVGLGAAVALESVLDLDEPVITAAFAYLKTCPLRSGRKGKEAPLAQLSAREFDETFEKLLAGEGTGTDWYDVLLDPRIQHARYLPSSVWRSLTAQLSRELSRAVGPALALRKRAVSQLISQGGSHAFTAFRDFIGEATCHTLATATLNLLYGRTPEYNELAIESLSHEDMNGRWGAAHTVAAKLFLGHIRSADIPRIEAQMLSIIDRGPRNDGAAALLRALPVDSQLRVTHSVRNGELLLRSLRTLQPLASPWRQLARSLAQQARDSVGVAILQEDEMLEALVTEALVHPLFEGRESARITLTASPYRHALGRAAMELLPAVATEQQGSLGEFLAFMVDSTHREGLAKLAIAKLPPAVKEYAYIALGRVPGPLPNSVRGAVKRELKAPATRATRGAIYALAMHGLLDEEPGLAKLENDPLVGTCGKTQGTAIFE